MDINHKGNLRSHYEEMQSKISCQLLDTEKILKTYKMSLSLSVIGKTAV